MSTLNRFISLAQKALEKAGDSSSHQIPHRGSSAQSPAGGSGHGDWRDMVRSAADRITGDSRPATSTPAPASPQAGTSQAPTSSVQSATDRAAIARYDYLLQTAEPGQLEQVHRDAFERLTPEQRQQVAARLRAELPPNEQPVTDSPEQLARTATRGEARRPGFLRKVFASGGARTAGAAGVGMAAGLGIGAAGGLLAAVAGGAVLSSVAAPLLAQATDLGVDFEQFAGGFDEFTGGAGDLMSSASEQVSGLGEGFEFPGLGDLGGFFDR